MPEKRRAELAKYRYEKAAELLTDAKLLLENGSFKSANNRAYYSIFHVLRAVLAIDGVEFKKHSGNIQYFLREHVKTGQFDVMSSDIVLSASRIRNASDYDDFYIASKAEASEQVDNADKFLKMVKLHLDERDGDAPEAVS